MEAAIVTLLFFTLLFAIMDGGILALAKNAVSSAARAGARSTSAAADDTYADYVALQRIRVEISPLKPSQLQYIVVYKASAYGAAPAGACAGGSAVAGSCNVYRASDLTRPRTDFGCKSPSALDGYWCPTTRKTALRAPGGPPDFVGVYIVATQKLYTFVYGSSKTLTSRTVIRVEPRSQS
ncbi:MAG: pilus assembly protein [Actinobacteria bacterium]|nr:pilus assembly protein [Actinomycetota bacterium]